tara:strand:- start:7385 stop:7687 length:303 start_codon:yes stop_codon:yes gene_type:complete
MKNLNQIDHIAIQVEDIDKSLKWYEKKFHFEKIYSDDTWAIIKFSNIKLALVVKSQHPNHFAILNDKISKNDVDVVEHRDKSISKYIKDIDGNFIELIKY